VPERECFLLLKYTHELFGWLAFTWDWIGSNQHKKPVQLPLAAGCRDQRSGFRDEYAPAVEGEVARFATAAAGAAACTGAAVGAGGGGATLNVRLAPVRGAVAAGRVAGCLPDVRLCRYRFPATDLNSKTNKQLF
jgi:hypothetical protein